MLARSLRAVKLPARSTLQLEPRLPVFLARSRHLCSISSQPDFFKLLRFERQFDLDDASLHHAYKQIMSGSHPDRFALGTHADKLSAANHAATVTNAYDVLKQPHTRAIHLLELLGMPLAEDGPGTQGLLDMEFLMGVMEVRESLESKPGVAELQELQRCNEQQISRVHNALSDAFVAGHLEQARVYTAELQYLRRIEVEISMQMPVT